MPVYKDKQRDTWFAKFNYRNWSGEIRTKVKRGFATKSEAAAWEREFLYMQKASMDMEFGEFVEVYFADKEVKLKDRTVMTKRVTIEKKILPYFGTRKMNEITPLDIMKWQNTLMNQGYKPTYLRIIQNQMTAVFNHAERFYGLKDNPCKKVDKMGKSNATGIEFWTKEEYDIFISAFEAKDEMYCLIFQMLFWLGLRIGELLALTFEDVDTENDKITVDKTYYRRDKTDYITPPKTQSSVRTVAVPHFLMEEIREYISRQYKPEPNMRLFPVTDRAVQKKMRQKTDEMHLKRIRVHGLRHSHVAYLIDKGVEPLMIAKRVGHESINTTMNVYGHLYPDRQEQVADMLNDAMMSEPENKVIELRKSTHYRQPDAS